VLLQVSPQETTTTKKTSELDPATEEAYFRAAVPSRLLQAEYVAVFAVCVFHIIRPQLSPAVHCVSRVHLTTRSMYRREK
jgi:hypothetical protein